MIIKLMTNIVNEKLIKNKMINGHINITYNYVY